MYYVSIMLLYILAVSVFQNSIGEKGAEEDHMVAIRRATMHAESFAIPFLVAFQAYMYFQVKAMKEESHERTV